MLVLLCIYVYILVSNKTNLAGVMGYYVIINSNELVELLI